MPEGTTTRNPRRRTARTTEDHPQRSGHTPNCQEHNPPAKTVVYTPRPTMQPIHKDGQRLFSSSLRGGLHGWGVSLDCRDLRDSVGAHNTTENTAPSPQRDEDAPSRPPRGLAAQSPSKTLTGPHTGVQAGRWAGRRTSAESVGWLISPLVSWSVSQSVSQSGLAGWRCSTQGACRCSTVIPLTADFSGVVGFGGVLGVFWERGSIMLQTELLELEWELDDLSSGSPTDWADLAYRDYLVHQLRTVLAIVGEGSL